VFELMFYCSTRWV